MSGTLIVGLDVSTRAEAEAIIEQLDGVADFFKIGYQLFYGGDGFALGKALLTANKRVFFDLKLLDIDNTVEKGVAAIADTGATMLSIHAYPHAMRAAAKAVTGSDLCVIGVTVLTSMDETGFAEAGYSGTIADRARTRIEQARDAGIGGIVSSGFEARAAREILGAEKAVVVPGIRPKGSAAGDQKRVMTPAEAVSAGASHLVVARPIVAAADPRAAARAIVDEIKTIG